MAMVQPDYDTRQAYRRIAGQRLVERLDKRAFDVTVSGQMGRPSARKTINRLYDIRNRFGRHFAVEKNDLLATMPQLAVRTASDAKKLHKALCYIRAFPDTPGIHTLACNSLSNFDDLVAFLGNPQRARLADSGIRATDIHYSFSFEVASWLARRHSGLVNVDWPEFGDTERLDELLQQLLEPAETDYFDSGQVSSQEWLAFASGLQPGTDFDWLISQLGERPRHNPFWTALYNLAEIPLRCALSDSDLSISANLFDAGEIFFRHNPMHNRVANAKKRITSSLESIVRLERNSGMRLIDVAMASLAARHRETLHFNYANPDEVYVADVGRGIRIAVTGLQVDSRYPLECTMGFLILSNGVPIGYGGASILFRQANTGINIFDEYRGSEAAWLWVQVMRVFHSLTGCSRYIANPYQFGSENPEALKSGAFWFYYRLGYRPVEREIAELARGEFKKIQTVGRYRTPLASLRKLATCDMHLTLPGARRTDLFCEDWIETAGQLATGQLAATGELRRSRARRQLEKRLANELNIASMQGWSPDEKHWFSKLCPLMAALDPAKWSSTEKSNLVKMVRAKGGRFELDYAREARNHRRYFPGLMKSCRRPA